MGVRVKDHDLGYRLLMKGLDFLKSFVVTVGIHEEDGGAPGGTAGLAKSITTDSAGRAHVGGKFASKKQVAAAKRAAGKTGGASLIEVAEWQEFGTSTIPARSFVGAWADEHEAEVTKQLKDETAKALRAGKSPAQRADQLAQRYAGQMQGRIAEGIPPPNAPATVAKKGSSTPLIDSGQLRSSIRGKVEAK